MENDLGIENEVHFKKVVRNNFLKILSKIKHKYKPSHIFIAFDSDGKNFRNQLLPSYKANRKEKPPELEGIKNEIYQFLKVNNFCFQIAQDVEADDLIASYITKYPTENVQIFTGDGDLAALVNNHVTLLLDKGRKIQEINIQNFHHFFSIPPKLFSDFKSLQGDKSDNVKGVDGLFRTEAIHILLEYQTIENYFENGDSHYLFPKMSQHKEKILTNKIVTTLKTDCPLSFDKLQSSVHRFYIPRNLEKKIGW